jgi:hypothetical protein
MRAFYRGRWGTLNGSAVVLFFVTDNVPFDQVDDIFGNIGGVVCDSFQMPGDGQKMHQRFQLFRAASDSVLDVLVHLSMDGIHFVVAPADLVGDLAV